VSLAARRQAGPPRRAKCSICVLETWIAANHPDDVAEHEAMYDDKEWSDREHADALAEEYGRPVSSQQLGVHRRGHRGTR
jgi:hypothetical protein